MRVNEKHVNIDYQKTKDFFKHRAEKFQENNPYSVTMYQDNNKELVRERNEYETEKLLSLLSIDKESEILDVACGIGRWADAIKTEVKKYCGIDFSDELIRIATERNKRDNYYYYVGSTSQLEKIIKQKRKGKFNIVLIVGIMLYLNDNDVIEMLHQIERCCEKEAVICIREPIGIEERLTLKDYYSDELKCDYNAIYRTRDEIKEILKDTMDIDESKITLDAKLKEDLELDSLDSVELIMSAEEEFGIEIPDEDVMNFKTVNDIVNYIEEHK